MLMVSKIALVSFSLLGTHPINKTQRKNSMCTNTLGPTTILPDYTAY